MFYWNGHYYNEIETKLKPDNPSWMSPLLAMSLQLSKMRSKGQVLSVLHPLTPFCWVAEPPMTHPDQFKMCIVGKCFLWPWTLNTWPSKPNQFASSYMKYLSKVWLKSVQWFRGYGVSAFTKFLGHRWSSLNQWPFSIIDLMCLLTINYEEFHLNIYIRPGDSKVNGRTDGQTDALTYSTRTSFSTIFIITIHCYKQMLHAWLVLTRT